MPFRVLKANNVGLQTVELAGENHMDQPSFMKGHEKLCSSLSAQRIKTLYLKKRVIGLHIKFSLILVGFSLAQ